MKTERGFFWRTLIIYFIFMAIAVIASLRIFLIDTSKREWYLSHEVKTKAYPISAKRGNIYSKNGTLLATSVPVYEIAFDVSAPTEPDFNNNLNALCDSLEMMRYGKKKDFRKRFTEARKKGKRYVFIERNVSIEELNRVKSFPIFNLGRFKGGLITEESLRRVHPYGNLGLRVIGYSRPDLPNGYVGIDGAYDEYLRGTEGVEMRRRIAGGTWIPYPSDIDREPVEGDDIITSIDVNIQDVAENALAKCMKENGAEQGCVIVMEVQTGMVEAMASLKYDKHKNDYIESYNFAIAGRIEPGSTFKAITMTALLEDNPKLNINRIIDLGKNGKKVFYGKVMSDSHVINDGHASIKECFEQSSNVAFATLAVEAFDKNPQRFMDLIFKTKINEPLNLDIKGEGMPKFRTPKDKYWAPVDLSRIPIGYALSLCPIHMITYYNAIANNGKMLRPQFVREIRRDNETIMKAEPIVINERIASEHTIKTLQMLLRGVVQNGTAKALSKCYFTSAGKTGTSHISGHGGYTNSHTASFIGYFPAETPRYTCLVVIQTSGSKYFGAALSLPVFKEVAEKVYATNLSFADDERQGNGVISQTSYDDVFEAENDSIVPDFKGMNITDAVYVAEKMGWRAVFNGSGRVEKTEPAVGTRLDKGETIRLIMKNK